MKQPDIKLVTIETIADLNRTLSTQRVVARRAKAEIDQIPHEITEPINPDDEDDFREELIVREIELLRKYANYPTLTEFQRFPHLHGMTHYGASFGVAIIVGEVLLPHIRVLQSIFARAHNLLLTCLLTKMTESAMTVDMLVPPLQACLVNVQLNHSLDHLSKEDRANFIRGLIVSVIEAMIVVLTEYGLVRSTEPFHHEMTPLGKRLLLHLWDIKLYKDQILEAHQRLRKEIPPK
jgi:hypothetical protein